MVPVPGSAPPPSGMNIAFVIKIDDEVEVYPECGLDTCDEQLHPARILCQVLQVVVGVVVVAHRLSTVKDAGQIVVLEKGSIVEQGRHQELIDKKGSYYNLVKNQLELGV